MIVAAWYARQHGQDYPPWMMFFLGIAPNLFATPIIMIYTKQFISKHLQHVKIVHELGIFLLSFVALVLWEYARFWIGEHPVDVFDILASLISGLALWGYWSVWNTRESGNLKSKI
ncbi:MAG: hypothetical protein KDC76_08025 [Bacteroidetes bacterium]|nr:hypothetical protein [Bacteroidota bacterium]